MTWKKDDVEILKRMWADGKTASEIASAIPGCAGRSAVIGKAHRLGLDARANPVLEDKGLHASVTRRLHMRLQKLALPSGGFESIVEAFAFTETGTPSQIARALGVPLARVETAVKMLEAEFGWQAA